MNRAGLTSVVTIVVTIALSMVLATTLAYALTTFTRVSLSPEISCTSLHINPPVVLEQAVWKEETSEIELTVKNVHEEYGPSELFFIMAENTWSCSSQCGACSLPHEGETKKLYVPTEKPSVNQLSLKVGECLISSVVVEGL